MYPQSNNPLVGFSIYKLAHSGLHAAIPNQFLRILRQYLTEYQGFGSVPSSVSVKGIILHPEQPHTPEARCIRDIPINKLQF